MTPETRKTEEAPNATQKERTVESAQDGYARISADVDAAKKQMGAEGKGLFIGYVPGKGLIVDM